MWRLGCYLSSLVILFFRVWFSKTFISKPGSLYPLGSAKGGKFHFVFQVFQLLFSFLAVRWLKVSKYPWVCGPCSFPFLLLQPCVNITSFPGFLVPQQQHFIQAKSQVFHPSPHPIIWKYPLGKDNCRSSKHLEKISPSLEL